LEPEPVPGSGVSLEPDGGVPVRGAELPEPFVPMFGQLDVEPELDPDVPELDEPVLDEPEFEVDDGVVVDGLDVEELLPEFPVAPVFEVVAALATSAPPATRPEVSAPMASMLRRRNGMGTVPFVVCGRPIQAGTAERALRVCVSPYTGVGRCRVFPDESVTIHRNDTRRSRKLGACTQDAHRGRPEIVGRSPTDQVSACSPANSTSASARRSHPCRGSPRARRGSESWRRDVVAGRPHPC
jgi:hypothetical protein